MTAHFWLGTGVVNSVIERETPDHRWQPDRQLARVSQESPKLEPEVSEDRAGTTSGSSLSRSLSSVMHRLERCSTRSVLKAESTLRVGAQQSQSNLCNLMKSRNRATQSSKEWDDDAGRAPIFFKTSSHIPQQEIWCVTLYSVVILLLSEQCTSRLQSLVTRAAGTVRGTGIQVMVPLHAIIATQKNCVDIMRVTI